MTRRGIHVSIYSLSKPPPSSISQESRALSDAAFYLLPVPFRTLRRKPCSGFLLRHPLRYTSALFRMLAGKHARARDRLRSLMHFGEGAPLAEKMLRDGVTHIHAHFASQSASVARVVHLLTRIPYSFTGHAHDIWQDRAPDARKTGGGGFCRHVLGQCQALAPDRGAADAPSKVHLVYHGLDVDNFPYCNGDGREKNLILSVGRLTRDKGLPRPYSGLRPPCGRGLAFPVRDRRGGGGAAAPRRP